MGAIFLDRDGVLNELAWDEADGSPESPLRVEDVRLIPGAAEACLRLQGAGLTLAVASNQPAAAKGKVSEQQLDEVDRRVRELLADQGVEIAAWRYCRHHPRAVVERLMGPCGCRKPAAGLLVGLADDLGVVHRDCWMIGDSDSDVLAGHRAGCRTMLIDHGPSTHRRTGDAAPDASAPDLHEASIFLVNLLR